jgi:hypothetical protein
MQNEQKQQKECELLKCQYKHNIKMANLYFHLYENCIENKNIKNDCNIFLNTYILYIKKIFNT